VQQIKDLINGRLKKAIDDSAVALSIDMYTEDFPKKAYLNVHETWVERKLQHAVLAVQQFGTDMHATINISTAINAILMETRDFSDNVGAVNEL